MPFAYPEIGQSNDELYEAAQEFFEKTEVEVQPARNWLLVRVLPREMMSNTGKIVVVSSVNKILLEGIVIRAFTSYWVAGDGDAVKQMHKMRGFWQERQINKNSSVYDINIGTMAVEIVSQVGPGDHILFPSHEGLPIAKRLDETKYRLVEECMVSCKLNYHPAGWLAGELGKIFGKSKAAKKKIAKLLEKADVVLKDGYSSKTMSGS